MLVTEVEHHAIGIVGPGGASDETGYRNTFRAIPAERTYRPARVTPKPRIAGLVTGVIDGGAAGPDAKYAQLDEQGRYLRSLPLRRDRSRRAATHRGRCG